MKIYGNEFCYGYGNCSRRSGAHCVAANRQHQVGQPNAGAAAVLSATALQKGSRRGISVRHQVVHQLGKAG